MLRDIALDCSTPMCDELNEHHIQREDSPEELDIQVKDQQEERVETLNKNQKKKRNRKIRIMNARKRVDMKQVCERSEKKEQIDANTTSPIETSVVENEEINQKIGKENIEEKVNSDDSKDTTYTGLSLHSAIQKGLGKIMNTGEECSRELDSRMIDNPSISDNPYKLLSTPWEPKRSGPSERRKLDHLSHIKTYDLDNVPYVSSYVQLLGDRVKYTLGKLIDGRIDDEELKNLEDSYSDVLVNIGDREEYMEAIRKIEVNIESIRAIKIITEKNPPLLMPI